MIHGEFIGIPGSGKSTIRDRVVQASAKGQSGSVCIGSDEAFLRAAKEKIDRPYRWILNFVNKETGKKILARIGTRSYFEFRAQNKFLSLYGKALSAFLGSSRFERMSNEDRETVIGGLLSAGSRYMAIKEGPDYDGLVLFDEGLIQKTMMFVSDIENPLNETTSLEDYLNYIPSPNLIVYITADINRCVERMGGRSKGLTRRLRKTEPQNIVRFLKNADLYMKNLVEKIEKKGETKILKFNNNGSENEIVKSLLASLSGYKGETK